MRDGNLDRSTWLLVAAGFHFRGGMDKANAELADYLVENGASVHLVAHDVDSRLSNDRRITFHAVGRPAGSFALGEFGLDRRGRDVARALLAKDPAARVVVNGGNCQWHDINWVHYVHHAWTETPADVPLWFRAKHRAFSARWRRAEKSAIRPARVVIANSQLTRQHLITMLGVPTDRVRTVYLSADAEYRPRDPEGRARARRELALEEARPAVAFVGALGLDRRKGFDTLWRAWTTLCATADWDAILVVAGEGADAPAIQDAVRSAGLDSQVRLLGHCRRVPDLLAAADLLVSPTRYEPYGLNVHEALCSGVPVIVSRGAGVAERLPAAFSELLLDDADDAEELVARLRHWRGNQDQWRARIAPVGEQLRQYGWRDMAAAFVAAAEGRFISSQEAATTSG